MCLFLLKKEQTSNQWNLRLLAWARVNRENFYISPNWNNKVIRFGSKQIFSSFLSCRILDDRVQRRFRDEFDRERNERKCEPQTKRPNEIEANEWEPTWSCVVPPCQFPRFTVFKQRFFSRRGRENRRQQKNRYDLSLDWKLFLSVS